MSSRFRSRASRNVSETISEEEEEFRQALDSIPPPPPPDGGWGWVVVFASFMINAIVDGMCYSFGILISEFVYHYNINSSSVSAYPYALPSHALHFVSLSSPSERLAHPTAVMSLSGALLLGVYMFSAPLASALCNKFGSRRVAMGGCIISFISLFLARYSPSAPLFLVLFGFCTGIGFGMMFMAAMVIVGFYFEKRRSIAATLAMCGSGVGMSTVAPLVTYLLEEFEWEQVLLLLSGAVLQAFVLGSLYRPIDANFNRRKKLILQRLEEDRKIGPQTCLIMQRLLEEKKRQRTVSTGSMNNVIITKENILVRPADMETEFRERKPSILNRFKAAIGRSKDNISGSSKLHSAYSSKAGTPQVQHRAIPDIKVNGIDTPPSAGSPLAIRHLKFTPTPSNLVNDTGSFHGSVKSLQPNKASPVHGGSKERSYHSVQDFATADNISIAASVGGVSVGGTSTASTNVNSENAEELLRLYRNHTPDNDRPMYRQDILYSGSVHHLPQYTSNIDNYVASITQVPQDNVTAEEDHGCCWYRLECLPKSIRDVLRSILDTSTFSSPTFVVLSISSFLTMMGYFVPFVFLPVYARSLGISTMDVAYLLSIMGGTNTLGRVIAGALGGKEGVDSIIINSIALVIAGGFVLALPHFDERYLLEVFSAVFGLCVAAFSSLRSLIVVELMGLDKLTTAFGQLVVLQGLGVIVGTPMAGLLYDFTGNFSGGFYLSGSAILVSGVMCFPLRKLRSIEKKGGHRAHSANSNSDEVKKAMLPDSLTSNITRDSAESSL